VTDPAAPREVACDERLPVSLIIASRNRPEMLADTVASITGGDARPAELVVVDQSDDVDSRIVSMAEEAGLAVQCLWMPARGLSRANNAGAAAARYDTLVFTHDDVLVERNWLRRLVDAHVRLGAATVVTGRVVPAAPEIHGGFAPTLSRGTQPAIYAGRIGRDVLKPLNMAIDRKALERVGGFDERLGPGTAFPGAEDSDLGFRLLEAGYRIAYVPEAVVRHRAWRPSRDYLPLRWQYGVAQGAFFAKHLRLRDAHMLNRFGWNALRRARRFPRRLWRERGRALGDPLFVLGNLVGAVRWRVEHGGA
jgi:GT2 family glycosyltransferase